MKSRMLALVGAAMVAWAAPVQGQLETMEPREETTVALQATKTLIDGDGLEWYTSVLRARLLSPLNSTTTLVVDWGLSIAGIENAGTDGTTSNPEIGVLFQDEGGRKKGYASVFLPVSFGFGDDDASVGTGLFDNPLRPERFVPDLVAVSAGLTPSIETDGAAVINFEIGGAAWIPTGDNGGDNEIVARYAAGIATDTESVRIRGDVEGLAIVSESDLSLGERTLHQLVVSVSGVNGGPSFFARVPLDDDLDGIDATLGFTIPFGPS